MAKPQQKPMITYTEILSRAIHQMQKKLKSWVNCMIGKQEYIEVKLETLCPKIEATKTLYKIETKTDY